LRAYAKPIRRADHRHPECRPTCWPKRFHRLDRAYDQRVRPNRPKRVVRITECSMADNVQAEPPDVEMVRPCIWPAHEADHAPKISQPIYRVRSHDRSGNRREAAAFGRADDQLKN